MRFLFFLTILLFNNQIANSCSCIYPGPIDDKQYNEYSLIAKGKIIKVIELKFTRIIHIRLTDIYKGNEKSQIIVIESPSQSGMCGIFPKVGENWLMFAYASGKAYETNLCTRSKNMNPNPNSQDYREEELKKDLIFLKAKRKPLKDKSSIALPFPITLQRKNNQ
jgi:hypothetical protein